MIAVSYRPEMAPLRRLTALLVAFFAATSAMAAAYEAAFSTYLGGVGWEHGRDLFTDRAGNIYVVGGTGPNNGTIGGPNNFPTTPGAYSTTYNGGVNTGTGVGAFGTSDVFITKFNASGQLVWSTFLGGPAYDRAYALEVDDAGYIYVAGRAGPGFPVTAGAMQTTFAGTTSGTSSYGHQNGFVAKLSPDGSQLIWATYVGVGELVRDFDIDQDGDVYALLTRASTSSNTMPSAFANAFTNAFRPSWGAGTESGLVKIKNDGSQAIWATWLGGSGADSTAGSVRVNRATETPYVLFFTNSADIVTAGSGADTTHNGNNDMFLAALDAAGSSLVFGTYLGGNGNDALETHSLALDLQGNAYVATRTTSSNFPVTPGAANTTRRGANDLAITKIGLNGGILASALIGGSAGESPDGIYVDTRGRIVIAGETSSDDFPVTSGAFQAGYGANADSSVMDDDAFVLVLSEDFTAIEYSSYLGGSAYDNGRTVFVGPDDALYVSGATLSDNLPTLRAFQPAFAGGNHNFAPGSGDVFVTKFTRNHDADGDGAFDPEEFIAGTDTLDRTSLFKADFVELEGAVFHLDVQGQKGRSYTLERTIDFLSWEVIASVPTLAAPQSLRLTDDAPAAGRGVYTVRATFP